MRKFAWVCIRFNAFLSVGALYCCATGYNFNTLRWLLLMLQVFAILEILAWKWRTDKQRFDAIIAEIKADRWP